MGVFEMREGHGVKMQETQQVNLVDRLQGPVARIVLAVTQQALLGPIGIRHLVVGVRSPGGRLEIATTDASNSAHDGSSGFHWSQAAPLLGAMRCVVAQRPASAVLAGNSSVVVYASAVQGSSSEVVIAAVSERMPNEAELDRINAALTSAVYTILVESDAAVPDATVVVDTRMIEGGVEASVSRAGFNQNRPVVRTGRSVTDAVAQSVVQLVNPALVVRYADQKSVLGTMVSLVVLEAKGIGAVAGATGMNGPGSVATSIAVIKAADAYARIEAEYRNSAEALPSVGDTIAGEQFALR